MLAAEDSGTADVYGRYNAVGAACGALGALAAGLPGVSDRGPVGVHAWAFAALIPVGIAGALCAAALSPAVEAPARSPTARPRRPANRLGTSRPVVARLAGLFAVDAAGGGLVTTGFLAYFMTQRYDVSVGALGRLFFAVSWCRRSRWRWPTVGAPLRAGRHDGRHPPAEQLSAGRDRIRAKLPRCRRAAARAHDVVPDGRADPPGPGDGRGRPGGADRRRGDDQRRSLHRRPVGPILAGAMQQAALGAPLVLAGTIKAGYDLALWRWARHLPFPRRPTIRRSIRIPRTATDPLEAS